mmetsp:Transcript_34358/g.80200  ORF Transcript_34358/g.80200 Transcript_34358/m.80200 type:complete len:269 (-) Transcript_34358:23-829(-)
MKLVVYLQLLSLVRALNLRGTEETNVTQGMPAPAVSTNGKTIDISAFSDAFSKSLRIKCKVKFDDMNANYPNIFHGLSASGDVVFTSHGLGPAYGGKRGKACLYSQTQSGMGPHGRGLDAPGGWIGTSKRMDDGNWHVLELVKTGTNAQIILDGEKVEAGLPSGKTAEDFILRPIKSIQVGSAKSSGFNGDIGDVEIHAGYANKLIYSDITCKGDGLPGKATCDEQDVTACDGKYTKVTTYSGSYCKVTASETKKQCLAVGPVCSIPS